VRIAAGYHPEIARAFNSIEFLHSTRCCLCADTNSSAFQYALARVRSFTKTPSAHSISKHTRPAVPRRNHVTQTLSWTRNELLKAQADSELEHPFIDSVTTLCLDRSYLGIASKRGKPPPELFGNSYPTRSNKGMAGESERHGPPGVAPVQGSKP
jgi:hypothetical protein